MTEIETVHEIILNEFEQGVKNLLDGMIITFTGGLKFIYRFINQLLGFIVFFMGLWVMILIYLPFKYFVALPVYEKGFEGLDEISLAACIALMIVIFIKNCRKFFQVMPENAFSRFINTIRNQDYRPEREGKNIPQYMKKRKKENVGFFFGEGEDFWFRNIFKFGTEKAYIGKSIKKDGHILVVGGAGSGKSACIAKNVLETWNAPIFAIDIKGELSVYYNKLKSQNKVSRNAIVFDPTSKECSQYDPYFSLRMGGEEYLVQNATEIALSIIPTPQNIKDPFWIQSAQNLLTGAILYYYGLGASFSETITGIQTTNVEKLIDEILDSDNLSAKIYVRQLYGLKLETLSGIAMEVANKIMVFATDLQIRDSLCDSNDSNNYFHWCNLEDDSNIFLRLPEDRLDQWSADITLKINQLIRFLERRADRHSQQGKKLQPILILLDEFPRLGKIQAIEGALTTLRSKNVTIAVMIQSLAQLDKIYGKESRQTILDNCPYKAILGVSDANSQKYFSDLIGSCEVERVSRGVQYDSEDGLEVGQSSNISKHREPIIFPHDLAKLKDVVLMTPDGFCRVKKVFAPRD